MGEYHNIYFRKRYKEQKEYLHQIKNIPCMDCEGKYPPHVMDFDHVTGKKVGNVSMLVGRSWGRLQAEVAKCDIVCANCHRERTYQRDQYTQYDKDNL